MDYKAYTKPEYYWNREISWLGFNERVLSEARDKSIPLFERLKFLSITASNLDEFFMVRVASLKDMVHAKYTKPDIAGMTPKEQLKALAPEVKKFIQAQYSTYNRSLLPALKKAGVKVVEKHEDLTEDQQAFVDQYFEEAVYPVLTPMAMDSARPFPLIRNKTLNIGALIAKKGKKDKEELEFATVQVPSVLPRIIEIPGDKKYKTTVVLLEEIIERNIGKLFLSNTVVCTCPYRIIRNADLTIDEDEAADLLTEIEKQLKKRQWGEVIRLDVEEKMDPRLLKILKMPYTPAPVKEMMTDEDIFTQIRRQDILLHHPYMSFDPVVDFVRQASRDPEVLAIKQTLYRVSGNSPIIAALAQAAENGKQVTVLVELKARFDEENNIVWAKKLEKAGCHVIYGLLGLKTHSKITLVVRKEEEGIRRYVHLGTGNYNDSTAKQYTDCGILTCSAQIGEDATAVFNMLSGYSEPKSWNKLVVAPIWMRDRFLHLIEMEQKRAEEGKKARIVAKMNSLCDKDVIAALYAASAAGVKIDLIVRGICCLKVGIPGVSENITVRSIVGNFLEHSRIFYFYSDGKEQLFMGSADWMPRNLDKRVEIVFPVEDPRLKEEVKHILQIQLADNVKAHILQPDGSYEKIDKRGKQLVNSQEYFCEEAHKKAATKTNPGHDRIFIPAEAPEEV